MEVKERIRTRRLELGLTLEKVGNYVGVSKSTVKKWESGSISNMRRDKIAKLSEILEMSPTELMGWEDQTKLPPADSECLLGSFLKNYREAHNLTVYEFARASGLREWVIRQLEYGTDPSTGVSYIPTSDEISKLADATGSEIGQISAFIEEDHKRRVRKRGAITEDRWIDKASRRMLQNCLPPDVPHQTIKWIADIAKLLDYGIEFSGVDIFITNGDKKSRPIEPSEYASAVQEIRKYARYVIQSLINGDE